MHPQWILLALVLALCVLLLGETYLEHKRSHADFMRKLDRYKSEWDEKIADHDDQTESK